ncbi:MAG: GDYXXLXY domain-containing protein [Alphaproteobacteria bacterium]|nr:GDYXXLXY domain-containing protein [Alphaproteobacteria bacterium]
MRVDYGLSAFFVPQGKGERKSRRCRASEVRLVVAVTGSGRSAPLRLLANGKVLLEDSAF